MIQTDRIAGAEGRSLAIRLGSTKMPDPITMPTIITVASSTPNFRGSLFAVSVCSGTYINARRIARPYASQLHPGQERRPDQERPGLAAFHPGPGTIRLTRGRQ